MNNRVDTQRFVEYLHLYQTIYAGCSPTHREFAEKFKISTSHVSYLLNRLEREGRIVYTLGRETARSVSVPEGAFLTRPELEALGVDWSEVERHRHMAMGRFKEFGGE